MDISLLQRTYSELLSSLFSEEIVNRQFRVVLGFREDDPGFVVQTISLFYDSCANLINDISSNLNRPAVDYNKTKDLVHQLKGSSKSIGAQRIADACVTLQNYCIANDLHGCFSSMQQLNQEVANFKSKLDALFTMEQQILAAGGYIPKIP